MTIQEIFGPSRRSRSARRRRPSRSGPARPGHEPAAGLEPSSARGAGGGSRPDRQPQKTTTSARLRTSPSVAETAADPLDRERPGRARPRRSATGRSPPPIGSAIATASRDGLGRRPGQPARPAARPGQDRGGAAEGFFPTAGSPSIVAAAGSPSPDRRRNQRSAQLAGVPRPDDPSPSASTTRSSQRQPHPRQVTSSTMVRPSRAGGSDGPETKRTSRGRYSRIASRGTRPMIPARFSQSLPGVSNRRAPPAAL